MGNRIPTFEGIVMTSYSKAKYVRPDTIDTWRRGQFFHPKARIKLHWQILVSQGNWIPIYISPMPATYTASLIDICSSVYSNGIAKGLDCEVSNYAFLGIFVL
jgi:hypothetical protein